MRCVFGPVPSRRLGRSLGIDLVPPKVCSYDCVYCQVGRTTHKTTDRREYVPVGTVLTQVEKALQRGPRPDHLTLSGSGEPTLNSGLGGVIQGLRELSDVPVAVLTNGSLLWDAAVQEECASADVVLPTLAAADEEMFRRLHRPARGLSFKRVVEGLTAFRRVYPGQLWLEVFLVAGMNSSVDQILGIQDLAREVRPDRIHLNTATRPVGDRHIRPVPHAELEQFRTLLGSNCEVIGKFEPSPCNGGWTLEPGDVLELLLRRPCSCEEMVAALGVRSEDVERQLNELLWSRRVVGEERDGRMIFRANGEPAHAVLPIMNPEEVGGGREP